MADMCDDNRFELIEKYKQRLIEATNIETAKDEMAVLNDILFRFWQMGWLESIDRMQLVKESAKTLMNSGGDSASCIAFRNAGRFIQNAIDGEAPDFEKVSNIEPERKKGEWIPVSEKLPEETNYYLVTIRYDDDSTEVDFAWFAHTDDYDMPQSEWREIVSGARVIAWMPLPEPYRGEP